MKASRFTDAQKAFIIRQGDEGTPVAEICRLKRIVADLSLDKEMLQDIVRRKI